MIIGDGGYLTVVAVLRWHMASQWRYTVKPTKTLKAPFDIVHTKITTEGCRVSRWRYGNAGLSKPTKSGKLAGSSVFSYVWPTSLDSSTVGFDTKAGILAFAVTSHPDFDDTPLFDENGDGIEKRWQRMALHGSFATG